MAVGSIIQDTDYNNIRTKVVNVLGLGSGNSGYGQATQSVAVSEGQQVTAAQWANLRYDIYNSLVHQTGTTPTVVSVNTGDTVRFGTSHPNNSYDTLANTIVSNRFNIGAGRFVTENLGSTSSGDISWELEAYVDITYTWPTAPLARFFFNSGGKIRVTSSFSPSVTKAQTTSWQNLLAAAGTQSFGGSTPSVNWFNLTTTYQTFYTATPSSPYSANRFRLQARCNVSNNSSGTANTLYIRVWLRDDYDDPAGQETSYLPQDSVNGTISVSTDQIRATGPMQPAPAAGNFSITGSSAASFSSFTSSNGGTTPTPPSPPPPSGPTYDESIAIVPSTVTASTGGNFTGYIYDGVPNSSFLVTYFRDGTQVLSGTGTLDSSGNFSAPGAFTTAGSYTVVVTFYGSGNTRSQNFTVV